MKQIGYAYYPKTSKELTIVHEKFKDLPHVFPIYAVDPEEKVILYTVYHNSFNFFDEFETCNLYRGLNKAKAEEVLSKHNQDRHLSDVEYAIMRTEVFYK